MPTGTEPRPVPVKTIMATIGLVLATFIGLYIVVLLARVEAWLVVAAFIAVVLNQPVEYLHRMFRLPRGLSVAVVYLVGILLVAGMLYAFIRPLVDQVRQFADGGIQTYVADARAGKGPMGRLVREYDLDKKLEENKQAIQDWATSSGAGALDVAKGVANGLLALITILVLSLLMILYGPDLLSSGVGLLSPPRRKRLTAVARDCARAVTGYVMGNLLISVIAAIVTFVSLWILGVPFKGVLALWVAFADLIPLVGATLGAIPTIGVAFLHSTTAGIIMLVVYIVYQQFENHVLQVVIMSKTVQINQLFVLVSVLIGVELFGFLGALLAIPAAGVIQVVVRDSWDHRRGRLKPGPTIGADEVSLDDLSPDTDDTIDDRLEDLTKVAAPPPPAPAPEP
ncbi:MAG: AI-2E family transporter [Actinomycetota bacterium]|nr:AI-2E family transporter [Actinomycetota bacterium]